MSFSSIDLFQDCNMIKAKAKFGLSDLSLNVATEPSNPKAKAPSSSYDFSATSR